jgi:hypothetical protein
MLFLHLIDFFIEMDDNEKVILEQNINQSLAQRELDLEDAIAIRKLKDLEQAERLLVIRRKKRMKTLMEQSRANSMAQAEANSMTTQAASQAKIQEITAQMQADIQKEQARMQLEIQRMQMEYELKMQLEQSKTQVALGLKQQDAQVRTNIEEKKEKAKDERVKMQAVEQSKLISQRQGKRDELTPDQAQDDIVSQLLGI